MKILVISHMYPSTFDEVAGIFVHQQVKELQRHGCEVRVISPVPWTPFLTKHLSNKWKRYSEIPQKAIWEGIEVYYPRYVEFPTTLFFSSSGKRMYFGIRKLIDEIHKGFEFDIIHAHVALPDGFAAMILNTKYNKPLVVTIHGQDLYTTLHKNANCKKALIEVFKQADKVIVVSTSLKQIAQTNIGVPGEIAVISNGIMPEEASSGINTLITKYAGNKVILSVSYLIARKGIDLNIKAISKLAKKYPDLKYIVIGNGPEMPFLKQLTHNLNLNQQVEFVGSLSHEKVMEYMAIADIFSLPSCNEGFGVVYLEAMLHGKPVIANQGEGIGDVIHNNSIGLLVKPKSVESLTESIEYLLNNRQRAQSIGEKAKQVVLENYTWAHNARSNMEVYQEILVNNE